MNNLSLSTTKTSFVAFLHRFHLVIFVVLVVGSLAFAVFSVSVVLQQSTQNDLSQAPNSQFDTATINRVNQLHTSDENTTLSLPGGRTNPFVE